MSNITPPVSPGGRKERLRCGFSTGTAAVAAARAALRHLATGAAPDVVAVRLPLGIHLPVPVRMSRLEGEFARASVVKDGGDDPDITHGAEIGARVRIVAGDGLPCLRDGGVESSESRPCGKQGVYLIAGTGVGMVTKAGLPVPIGEPAINPVPRQMFSDNLAGELRSLDRTFSEDFRWAVPSRIGTRNAPGLPCISVREGGGRERDATVFVPFDPPLEGRLAGISVEVEIEVPKGEELARHTLNPRLGIIGGISILGTTGIVKPFSHEAYEETIQAALSVAASNGCETVVLSTGGKSERFAREMLPDLQGEAFVQIADFFAFAVREACRFGFKQIIHSVFFGKAVKMARGHSYTHAHSVPLELQQVAEMAGNSGYGVSFCGEITSANTARHALEILSRAGAGEVVRKVALKARAESARLADGGTRVRLILFDYDGRLLADED